jgi:hypothetical protein
LPNLCSCAKPAVVKVVFVLPAWLWLAAASVLGAAKPPLVEPTNATPWLASVEHRPEQPRAGETVRISATVLGRIEKVRLLYQLVDPGAYLELSDPAYKTNWITLPMQAGATSPTGKVFSLQLPASLQQHRRLVRYRLTASEGTNALLTAPATNAPAPNFAYFVYDGIPAWRGAINPKSDDPRLREPVTFPAEIMRGVQAYHLLGKRSSIENATWKEQAGGREYKYTGTLVADGCVYDHIRYRARGGSWRYAMGKNMWKFDFTPGHPLAARDDVGRPYPVPWSKVNLRACIQQGDYGHRGEQGLFESVGFRLFNLAGADAPRTHWIQLRIIDEAQENPPDQYHGDFWGLYLAIEEVDGRFLKARNLPDGNVYKMEGGSGALSHHGVGTVTNRSDLDQFLNAYNSRGRTEPWWRTNLNLASYYSYRAIVECIHHYDISDGKNYYYYLDPLSRQWQVIPWDIDLTWADNMFGGGDEPFNSRVLSQSRFRVEYQNRLREIRDLLFNPEQTGQLLDECASVIWSSRGPALADADRAKWDFHPIMAMGGKAGQGLFYQITPTKNFPGMVELMKGYVQRRGAWIDRALLSEARVPASPTIEYAGPPGFPASQLRFRCSPHQGNGAFAAMKWRLAEITPSRAPSPSSQTPAHFEIEPVWEGQEQAVFAAEMAVPAGTVKPAHTYRVRVRMKHASGAWSHWSPPCEFTAGE